MSSLLESLGNNILRHKQKNITIYKEDGKLFISGKWEDLYIIQLGKEDTYLDASHDGKFELNLYSSFYGFSDEKYGDLGFPITLKDFYCETGGLCFQMYGKEIDAHFADENVEDYLCKGCENGINELSSYIAGEEKKQRSINETGTYPDEWDD